MILIVSTVVNIPRVEAIVSGHYAFSNKWGTFGSGNGQFKSPEGIAVDSSGRAYVADTGNNRIQVFKLASPCTSGTTQIVPGVCFVKAWGSIGSGNGQFNKPVDVALDSSGRVYVADSGNKRIQMFKGSGAFMKAWATDGPGTAQFESVVGVALDTSTNNIYVAESTVPGHIHKFLFANPCPVNTIEVVPGICFIAKWTFGISPEVPPDPRERLSGVAVNSATHEVYVSDYKDVMVPGNPDFDVYSIIKNTGDGIFLGRWGGSVASGFGQFYHPTGVAVDSSGHVYVADTGNTRIQAFKIQKFNLSLPCPVGTTQIVFGACLITKWGSFGSANGQFINQRDVTVDSSGLVYVADTGNNRIQVFFWKPSVGGTTGGGNEPGIVAK